MGSDIVKPNEKELEIKDRIENNTLVEYWQSESDFEKLADATIKTMQFINEEQIKELMLSINKNNEKVLSMTFEGVKKRHENELRSIKQKNKWQLIMSFLAGLAIGILVVVFFVYWAL